MRQSMARAVKRAVRPQAKSVSIPAPVGGWNARDSIADMDPLDAVRLTNFFPATTYVQLRLGYSRWSTGYGAQVETVLAYSGAGTNKMFGIAGGAIYDATAGGAVGVAAVTGLTNSRWQYVNVATPGGNFIEMCNGADGVYTYDGTTFVDRSASITGVTAANLIGINNHKFRLWFVERNTLVAWYLPTSSIQGAASALDLSSVARKGGFLMAMATWTIDAGYGVDDLAVFITSNGEVIVYRGTDPSSATTWALVGVFEIGSPVGRRCCFKWKGDLIIITQDGLVPLSGALQSSRVNPRIALTDKIQFAMSEAVTNYGSHFGWQALQFPKQNMLLMNVPVLENSNQQQYVMNTITGSWCNFTGWSANCFELFEDDLYFGSTNYIAKAWDTFDDNSQAIEGQGLQAFNYFDPPGQNKIFTMIRPTFSSTSQPSVFAQINTGFNTASASAPIATATSQAGKWGTAKWGSAKWGSSGSISRVWAGASGVDYCGAPNIKTMTSAINLKWISTDVVYSLGGII